MFQGSQPCGQPPSHNREAPSQSAVTGPGGPGDGAEVDALCRLATGRSPQLERTATMSARSTRTLRVPGRERKQEIRTSMPWLGTREAIVGRTCPLAIPDALIPPFNQPSTMFDPWTCTGSFLSSPPENHPLSPQPLVAPT